MSEWDVTDYAAKDNLLGVLRREADALFELAENGPWTAATACPEWEAADRGRVGRLNAGTIRGDLAMADQFLNSFFRI